MEDLKLGESEYRFMTIIWDAEPLSSRQLVELALAQLGWKKSTTYTVLKKLTERGFARNEDSLVTSLIPREAVQTYESHRIVERTFGGSLPHFLAAFMGERKLTKEEADELMALIDQHKEG